MCEADQFKSDESDFRRGRDGAGLRAQLTQRAFVSAMVQLQQSETSMMVLATTDSPWSVRQISLISSTASTPTTWTSASSTRWTSCCCLPRAIDVEMSMYVEDWMGAATHAQMLIELDGLSVLLLSKRLCRLIKEDEEWLAVAHLAGEQWLARWMNHAVLLKLLEQDNSALKVQEHHVCLRNFWKTFSFLTGLVLCVQWIRA